MPTHEDPWNRALGAWAGRTTTVVLWVLVTAGLAFGRAVPQPPDESDPPPPASSGDEGGLTNPEEPPGTSASDQRQKRDPDAPVGTLDAPRSSAAPDPDGPRLEISLRQAILTALTNNLGLEAERLRKDVSALDVMASYGIFDPVVFSNADHTDFEEPTSSALDTGGTEFGVVTGKNTSFDLGVRNRFSTGMVAELVFDQFRRQDDRAFQLLNPSYRSNLGLTLTQPLLRGAGADSNLADVRLAKADLRITNQQYRAAVQDLGFRVIEAYWQRVFALQDLRVKEESLELAENEVRVTENKVRLGLWAQLELDQALTEEFSRKAEWIAAIKAAEDAHDNLMTLLFPMDGEVDWDLTLVTTDELEEVDLGTDESWFDSVRIPDWRRDLGIALEQRPEVVEARLALRRREVEIDRAEDSMLPLLDLRGGYTWGELSEEWGENVRDVWFADSHTWTAGASFEFPIGNRSARAALRQAKLERRRSTLLLREQESLVATEVRESIRAIEAAVGRIRFTHRAFLSAEKQLRAAESRRDRGFLTNFEVLQFQRDLAQADANRNDAWREYRLAVARSELAKGGLLLDLGIELALEE